MCGAGGGVAAGGVASCAAPQNSPGDAQQRVLLSGVMAGLTESRADGWGHTVHQPAGASPGRCSKHYLFALNQNSSCSASAA